MAIDSSGNVYVTGHSPGDGTGYDYATVKYDTNGNELWVARHNGTRDTSDLSLALAVDGSGNVYVTGESDGDYCTIKYDTDGNELWVAHWDGPAGRRDQANALVVDDSGNVYVAGAYGYAQRGQVPVYMHATVKYDTDGNEMWDALYMNSFLGIGTTLPFVVAHLAVDEAGNVYLGGDWVGLTDTKYFTLKYVQVSGGCGAAPAAQAASHGSVSVSGASVFSYFFVLMVPALFIGIRKVCYR
jgi:hypothetical protein